MIRLRDLRVGNLVIYEACDYEIKGSYFKDVKHPDGKTEEVPVIIVKSSHHQWENETCGIGELEGLPITPEFLEKNGFKILNKSFPEIWIKDVGGYKYLRYHAKVKYLDFETVHTFSRVPWAITYVHQLQNACNDYGLDITFKV